MSNLKSLVPSKAVNVRLDIKVKRELEALATLDDRPLSSLIRRAISDYLDSNPVVKGNIDEALSQAKEPLEAHPLPVDTETALLTFRLPSALLGRLEGHGRALGETVSEVVRRSILAWTVKINQQQLGTPEAKK